MATNRIKLEVCGVTCVLLTEESETYMKELCGEAEKLISALLHSSGSVSVAAVTAALSYLDEKKKTEAERESIRQKDEEEIHRLSELLNAERQRSAQLEDALQKMKKTTATGTPVKTSGQLKNPLREFENITGEGLVTFYEKKS